MGLYKEEKAQEIKKGRPAANIQISQTPYLSGPSRNVMLNVEALVQQVQRRKLFEEK